MRAFAGWLFLLVMLLAANAQAATVYLNDGSVITCQSFWRSHGTVYVKVNRDVVLQFAPNEVNLKKSVRGRHVAKKHRPAPLKKGGVAVVSPAARAPAKPGTPVPLKKGTAAAPHAVQKPSLKPVPPATATPAPVKPVPPPAHLVLPAPLAHPPVFTALGGEVKLLLLVFIVISIASWWVIFAKAGEPGWAALIPIYNLVVFLKVAGRPIWWLILFLVPVVGLIFFLLACLSLAQRFNKSPLYGVLLFLFGIIMFPLLAVDKTAHYTP